MYPGIQNRLDTTLAELDSTEKFSDFLRAIKEGYEKPSVVSKEMRCVEDVIVGQGIDIDARIAFSHALSMEQGKRMTFAGDNNGISDDHDDESTLTRNSSEMDPTDLDHYDDVKSHEWGYVSCTACKIFERRYDVRP